MFTCAPQLSDPNHFGTQDQEITPKLIHLPLALASGLCVAQLTGAQCFSDTCSNAVFLDHPSFRGQWAGAASKPLTLKTTGSYFLLQLQLLLLLPKPDFTLGSQNHLQ